MMRSITFKNDPLTGKQLKKAEHILPLTLRTGGIEALITASYPAGINIIENTIDNGINVIYKTEFDSTKYSSSTGSAVTRWNITSSTTSSLKTYLVSQEVTDDEENHVMTVNTTIRILWFSDDSYHYRDITATLVITDDSTDVCSVDLLTIHSLSQDEYLEMLNDKAYICYYDNLSSPAYSIKDYRIYFGKSSDQIKITFGPEDSSTDTSIAGFCKDIDYYAQAVVIPSSVVYMDSYIRQINELISEIQQSIVDINSSISALERATSAISKYFITR